MRILLLSALVGLAACSQPDAAPRLKGDEVLLQVSAVGRTEARPDEARIVVGFSNNAATAQNNQIMARLVAGLEGFGVKADDVQTRNLSLSRIDYGPQRGQFRAENLVDVRIRDVAKAGGVISAATEAGGNVVSGPNLHVSDPERADAAAYAAAYKAARARADTYAEAAGLKVRRVLVIRDGGVSAPPVRYGDAYATEERAVAQVAAVAPPPVSAGVDTRRVRVEVDFALTR